MFSGPPQPVFVHFALRKARSESTQPLSVGQWQTHKLYNKLALFVMNFTFFLWTVWFLYKQPKYLNTTLDSRMHINSNVENFKCMHGHRWCEVWGWGFLISWFHAQLFSLSLIRKETHAIVDCFPYMVLGRERKGAMGHTRAPDPEQALLTHCLLLLYLDIVLFFFFQWQMWNTMFGSQNEYLDD